MPRNGGVWPNHDKNKFEYYKCIICGDDMLLEADHEQAAKSLFEMMSSVTLDECRDWIRENN